MTPPEMQRKAIFAHLETIMETCDPKLAREALAECGLYTLDDAAKKLAVDGAKALTTLSAKERQQLAEAADELEAFQLELHGGPHDKRRPAICIAVATMRIVAGVNADPLARLRNPARTRGVALPAVAVEMVCRESMCANMERCQFPHACREQPRTSGVAGTLKDQP